MEEYDQVELKSLALPQPILAPSPWTHFQPSGTISRETTIKLRWQPQPGTVSINLSLMPPAFVTVARGDVLDGNTMHYGILAKSIRAKLAADQIEELDIYSVFESVTELVREQCRLIGPDRQSNSLAPIRKMMVQVEFPRAGMFAKELRLGEETDFTRSSETPGHRAWFELCELRMEVLIGVNDYERAAPQQVIAQVSCHWNGKAAGRMGEGDFVFHFEATILEVSGLSEPVSVEMEGVGHCPIEHDANQRF